MTAPKRNTLKLLSILTAVSTIILFQNCGSAKFGGSTESASTTATGNGGDSAAGTLTGGGTSGATGSITGGGTTGSTGSSGSTGSAGSSGSNGSNGSNGSMGSTGSVGATGSGQSTTPNCGNQILVNGSCVDFACQSVVSISAAQLNQIPARTSAGVCYAYKIFSAIPNAPSTQTTMIDPGVISANHDGAGTGNHNPYLLGKFQASVNLAGPRVVKLAGALNATSPILVDNFVLYGVFPSSLSAQAAISYYRASGTTDSGVRNGAGVTSNSVLFSGSPVAVQAFGSSGTSSVAPINISTSITPNVATTLDIRAEDCGGQRQLSDVYLLFQ